MIGLALVVEVVKVAAVVVVVVVDGLGVVMGILTGVGRAVVGWVTKMGFRCDFVPAEEDVATA